MKKYLLLFAAAIVSIGAYAQDQPLPQTPGLKNVEAEGPASVLKSYGAANKGTGLTTATRYVPYANQGTGPYVNYVADYAAPYDSGRLSGINVYNNKGYAQHYNGVVDGVSPTDTTLQINGLIARFTGTKSASSTKSVVLSVWKRDAVKTAITGRTKFYAYGLPLSTPAASVTVPFANVITNNKGNDTGLTIANFSSPLTGVNYNFYAGYTIAYTWSAAAGDTIGLSVAAYASGAGIGSYVLETGTLDTLVTSYSVVQTPSGTWKTTFDPQPDIETNGNLVVFPVVQLSCPKCGLSVNGLTRNNLVFYGSYPNPAMSSTTVKFALKNRADVTLSIVDASGRTVKRMKETGLSIGEHLMPVDVSAFAAGNYTYLVETSEGDGLASQFTIAR